MAEQVPKSDLWLWSDCQVETLAEVQMRYQRTDDAVGTCLEVDCEINGLAFANIAIELLLETVTLDLEIVIVARWIRDAESNATLRDNGRHVDLHLVELNLDDSSASSRDDPLPAAGIL